MLRKAFHEVRNCVHVQRVTAVPKFSRITAAQSLESHDAIEQLRASLKEEHLLKMDWALTLFKHTLLPMQVARALVQATPTLTLSPSCLNECYLICLALVVTSRGIQSAHIILSHVIVASNIWTARSF